MKIKAVMIDFDGTLANTNGLIIKSHQHTFRTFLGHEGNEKQIKTTFGEPLWLTMEKFFGKKVFLKLWVKVRSDWRNSMSDLKTLGFERK